VRWERSEVWFQMWTVRPRFGLPGLKERSFTHWAYSRIQPICLLHTPLNVRKYTHTLREPKLNPKKSIKGPEGVGVLFASDYVELASTLPA
jgi:hypothetical protein